MFALKREAHRVSVTRISLLLALLLAMSGCVSRAVNVNVNIDNGTEPLSAESAFGFPPYGRIGIINAEMQLYDVSAGGVSEYRNDWSQSASKQAARSAALTLKKMDYNSIVLPSFPQSRDFYRLKTEMRYHCTAFQSDFFAARKSVFGDNDTLSFSISPQDSLGSRYDVDGFLYIYGFGEKFSDERRQFLSESPLINTPPPERTFVALILARKDGRILWYKHLFLSGDYDMRLASHSLKILGALFE